MHLIFALWLCINLWYAVPNSTGAQIDLDKYVVAPQEKFLLLVASQPESPLQLEQFRLLLGVEPRVQPKFEFKIRNIGRKSIVRYTISYRTSKATGGTLSARQPANKVLLPGEVASESPKGSQIVPLSDEIRQRVGLDKEEPILVVLMVENVVFDDGSSFSATATSKAFFDFFLAKLQV